MCPVPPYGRSGTFKREDPAGRVSTRMFPENYPAPSDLRDAVERVSQWLELPDLRLDRLELTDKLLDARTDRGRR